MMESERADHSPAQDAVASLEQALGYTFRSRQLLLDALTHRSYVYEYPAPDVVSNERLEFLGDAVIGLISSDLLFTYYPKSSEGDLTNLRAALVRASTLGAFARRFPIAPALRLGRGEEVSGGRERELLLARAFEAVVGALYLDGGMSAARAFLEPLLHAELERIGGSERLKDDKSLLQELAQAQLGVTPVYRVVGQEGPSHDRTFVVEVLLGELVAARGAGRSKRQAEQAAAHAALQDDGWQTS